MNRRNDYAMNDQRNPYGSRGGYVDSRSDYRNPYGSRGGYVDSRRDYEYREEDMRGRDYRNDYNSDYNQYDSRSYDRNDYRQSNDYNRDYRGYEVHGMMRPMDYESGGKYEKDLHKWIEKMEKKDRFGAAKEQIIQRAKQMKIPFEEFTEEEFYAAYLAMVTDYKKVANDFNVYIEMAKEFLMDDDIAVSPSEKIQKYLKYIVMGKE